MADEYIPFLEAIFALQEGYGCLHVIDMVWVFGAAVVSGISARLVLGIVRMGAETVGNGCECCDVRENVGVFWGSGELGYGGVGEVDGVYLRVAPGAAMDQAGFIILVGISTVEVL